MFDRSFVVQEPLSGSKTFQSVFQCLKLVLLPRLVSLVIFCVLYTIAEYHLTNWYFGVYGFVWKPAFPWSWRLLFLLLFAVPAFSFLHLSLLTLHRLVRTHRRLRRGCCESPGLSRGYIMLPRSESNSMEERELSDARDDEDCELANTGGGDLPRPRSPSQRSAPRHLFSSNWYLQFIFWLAIFCSSLWICLHYKHQGDLRYLPLIQNAVAHPNRTGYANQDKIFIGAMFYNNERVIPYWSDSLIKVIHYLGADNVFVSVLESGSDDRSPVLLQDFNDKLDAMNVSKRILTQDNVTEKLEDMGGNNRIHFLSALRNRVLEPLVESGGYDKVIFSNDVFVEPETIVELLKTADGEYDMVCGMDFGHFGLYDTWVLRDKQGRLASSIWPYFFDVEDHEAMQSESPVPVFTCWNGIVVFKADPVLPIHLRSNRTLSGDPLPFDLPITHPAAHDASLRGPSPALTPPMHFRASAPDECFSSESFLFPYDLRRSFNLQRIFVNPRVIVAYNWRFYKYFKWLLRHPVLKWWIEKMYDGVWMQRDVMVIGDAKQIWRWDGGDCHPWW